MNRQKVVLLGLAAATAVAIAIWWPRGEAVAPPAGSDAERGPQAPSAGARGELVASAGTGTERSEATPAPAAVEAWLAHPFTLGLEVQLVDAHGMPLANRTLRGAAPGCTFDDLDGTTDAHGVAVVEWPARAARGEVVLADPLGFLHRFSLQHGVRRKITLGGRGVTARAAGQSITLQMTRNDRGRQPVVLSGVPFVRDFATPKAEDSGKLHPFSEFRTAAAEATTRTEVQVTTASNVSFTLSNLALEAQGAAVGGAAPTIALAGTVYGEDGKPVADAAVVLLRDGPQPSQRGTTDQNGQFRFDQLTVGDYTVRAGGDRDGLGTSTAHVAAGTTTVAVHLQTGTAVRGVVTTADGKACAKARLIWRAENGAWWDLTTTDDAGRFVFANLPDGRGTVLLLPDGQRAELPLAVQPQVLANGGDLWLVHDPAQTGTLRFELPSWVTDGGEEVTVRLWNDDLGLGVQLRRQLGTPLTPNAWNAEHLASGWYRLEVQVPSLGCFDLGRQWLEPGGKLEFGSVVLPKPGAVELRFGEAPPAAQPGSAQDDDAPPPPPPTGPQTRLELYAIRADLDVQLEIANLDEHCDLRLPSGDYALARQVPGSPVEWHRFAVRSGETVQLPASK